MVGKKCGAVDFVWAKAMAKAGADQRKLVAHAALLTSASVFRKLLKYGFRRTSNY